MSNFDGSSMIAAHRLHERLEGVHIGIEGRAYRQSLCLVRLMVLGTGEQ
jgi:hypothetical protein